MPKTQPLPAIPVIGSLKYLGSRYAVWLVDVWGVMHNGVRAFPQAVEACRSYRAQGGKVLLLSNSPRPTPAMQAQLHQLGVSEDAYDATVTSGDLTRTLLSQTPGVRVFHLGPERDKPILHGLDLEPTSHREAELVLCSGLFNDETETPEDYRELLTELAQRQLSMICANPDHMVQRGSELIYCAGALAALYTNLGAPVVYAGKPHPPIYELAMQRARELSGRDLSHAEVLAIGDGLHTDMQGAAGFGLDAVFIASGLHAPQGGEESQGDLAELFAGHKPPLAAMRALAW